MDFKLPELGEGVVEGELVKWLVAPGDSVTDDQPLAEVMTDKATIEVPAPFTGTIGELSLKEGDTVEVGQTMLTYETGAGGAKKSAPKKEEPKTESQPAPTAHQQAPSGAQAAGQPTSALARSGPVAAAPAARRLAREKGVEVSQVPGSGPNGRILKEDIERFVQGGSLQTRTTTQHPQGGEKRVPFRGLRRKIAENMRLSKDKAAHFTYVEEANVTELVKIRKHAKDIGAQQGIKVTFLPFIMKAMVAALRQYPILNSSLDEEKEELVYKHFYNISLSVQTDDGLMAPVIKNIEHKSILEISKDIQDVVERARTKKLTKDDFDNGTITLTNAGTIGGLFATPVINYPQVAILGFNKIFKKPVVATIHGQDKIVIRDWTYFSISLDHRIVDGAIGAEFMKLFIKYVENPSLLLLESF